MRNVHASHVHLQRKLDALPSLPAVPDGFAIRPLADAAEVAAYAGAHRAAFGSEAMTAQWRERTIGTPLYQPDLDLVAAAPRRDARGVLRRLARASARRRAA